MTNFYQDFYLKIWCMIFFFWVNYSGNFDFIDKKEIQKKDFLVELSVKQLLIIN